MTQRLQQITCLWTKLTYPTKRDRKIMFKSVDWWYVSSMEGAAGTSSCFVHSCPANEQVLRNGKLRFFEMVGKIMQNIQYTKTSQILMDHGGTELETNISSYHIISYQIISYHIISYHHSRNPSKLQSLGDFDHVSATYHSLEKKQHFQRFLWETTLTGIKFIQDSCQPRSQAKRPNQDTFFHFVLVLGSRILDNEKTMGIF